MNAFTTSTPAEPALVPGPAIQIGIDGMTCASCVRRVEKAIASAPGVARASVNLATERAEVTFAGKPDLAPILAAVSAVGYEARADTIELAPLFRATAFGVSARVQFDDGRAGRYFALIGVVVTGSAMVIAVSWPIMAVIGWVASGWALVGLIGFESSWPAAARARRGAGPRCSASIGKSARRGSVAGTGWRER